MATAITKHSVAARRSKADVTNVLAARGIAEEKSPAIWWPVSLAASFAGPLLLGLAFPTVNAGPLAFIALVPLFLVWAKSSWKQALWFGWLSGIIMFVVLFHWMIHSIGDFIGSWSWLALALLCTVEGFFVALVALAAALIGRGQFRALCVVAVPAAWLLGESLRTRGSLGVPFGELGLVAAHLPWLLPLASFGGVYLISAMVALANGAIAGIIGGTPLARRTGAIALAVLAIVIAVGAGARHRIAFDAPKLRVGIAQGNISQREKWSPAIFERTLTIYSGLTHDAAAQGARLVVWPETVVTSYPLQEPWLLARLASVASHDNVFLMAGTIDRPRADGYYNALLEITPNGSVGGVYHKRFLVPFAEYLPLDSIFRPLPLFDSASRFLSGPGPHLLNAAGMSWGTLICYESAFAPYARATANAGADAIIVATDDAWFGGTSGPYQHADVAVIEAVSTGRWIVRGADTGISDIIAPDGTIVASLGLNREGVVVANVGRGIVTPYDRFGIGWLLVLALVAVVAGLWRRKEHSVGWRSRRGSW